MHEQAERPEPVPLPAPQLKDANLRPILVTAGIVWAISFPIALALSDRLRPAAVAEEFFQGLAGAGFAVVLAGLLFDRLKRQAEREAKLRYDEQQAQLRQLRRQVWESEYLPLYEALTQRVTEELCMTMRVLFSVFREEPVRRALARRGSDLRWRWLDTEDLARLHDLIDRSRRPQASGARALARVEAAVRRTAEQLSEINFAEEEESSAVDRVLLEALIEDAEGALAPVKRSVQEIRRDLSDLRDLHLSLLDDHLAPPELSIGVALYRTTQIMHALADWEWELRETSRGGHLGLVVVAAKRLSRSAADIAGRSVALYGLAVALREHAQVTSERGLEPMAADLLGNLRRSAESSLEFRLEQADKEEAQGSGGWHVAKQSAEERTFLKPTVQEILRDPVEPITEESDEQSDRQSRGQNEA